MADDDGLISGLTEEQLITNEEMDALVKEVSNPALARPARVDFYLVRRSVVPRPRRSHRPPTRPPRPRRRSSKPSAPTVSCTRRSTNGRPTSWYVAAPPIRAHPVLRPSLGTRVPRIFSPTFTRAREPSSPRRLLDPALTPSALQRSQEGCLKRLAGLSKPFKYVVTCNFVQKAGAGMHTASTALWDGKVDGKHTVQWENQTIQCITTVYWLAV